jgi:hypothetical protein
MKPQQFEDLSLEIGDNQQNTNISSKQLQLLGI